MSDPTTLRALAGLPSCQNTYTYTYGVMELEGVQGVQGALDKAAGLLDRARSAGIPVIHIQHDDGPGSLYDVSGHSGAIVDQVAPRDGEQVVVKNYPNSFVATDLDAKLKGAQRAEPGHRGVHDGHVRELQRQASVQPRLCAHGRGRRRPATKALPGWPEARCRRKVCRPHAWPGCRICSPLWCLAPGRFGPESGVVSLIFPVKKPLGDPSEPEKTGKEQAFDHAGT